MVASVLARSAGGMPCWSKLPAGRARGHPLREPSLREMSVACCEAGACAGVVDWSAGGVGELNRFGISWGLGPRHKVT